MTDYEITQISVTRPDPAEIVMALVIMAMLVLVLAVHHYNVTYEPVCVPAIVTAED